MCTVQIHHLGSTNLRLEVDRVSLLLSWVRFDTPVSTRAHFLYLERPPVGPTDPLLLEKGRNSPMSARSDAHSGHGTWSPGGAFLELPPSSSPLQTQAEPHPEPGGHP